MSDAAAVQLARTDAPGQAGLPEDLNELVQHIGWLGLVGTKQLRECQSEVSGRPDAPEALLAALRRKGLLSPFQIEKLRRGDRDGYFVGGYRLRYKIASGTFGRVYRGDDPRTGRAVAVKVLRSRWHRDAEATALFEREGQVAGGLSHPNVVRILGAGRDEATGLSYVVTEFVEGGTLRDLLAARGPLPAGEALRLVEDLARGLAYMHAQGVTHGDVKATNVLVSSQGNARLADFGLGRRQGGEAEAAGAGRVRQSADYAGLEKAAGSPAGDPRSDLYFLGCLLYELLTGRPPLAEVRDAKARASRRRFEDVPVLRPDDVGGHPAVVRLVEAMMALDPARRYQTAGQLLEAVRQARAEVTQAAAGRGLATVYVVESHPRLQDAIRTRLKDEGYRVLLAADPQRAVERFNQHGFDGLVVDAGSGGPEAVVAFRRILTRARQRGLEVAGVLLLGDGQDELAEQVRSDPLLGDAAAVLTRPITLKGLVAALRERLPAAADRLAMAG